jgi:predicted dehydrogenase
MKNTTNFSRRRFVKNASLLAGGTLAVPFASHANFFSGADDSIKIALVGAGGRGTGAVVQALKSHTRVKLVAIADAFGDRVEKCMKSLMSDEVLEALGVDDPKAPGSRIDVPAERRYVGFDGYQKAIAHADVVLLCTPPGFRPIHFEECIKQGKHVFMEKPVAVDPAGINKVLASAAIAKQKKLNVIVGLQRRYQNSYRALYEQKALIGDIISGQVWWNNDGVWVNPRKPGQTEMEYQMRNWYYFNWLCGDHIVEQHIHNIDVMNWFKNDYPEFAQGMGGRQVRNGKDHGEIFDHHFVEFHYPDGAILNSQCRHIPGTMSKVDELLIGTKGKIYGGDAKITDSKGKLLFQYDKKGENNPYQNEHDELFAAIAKGEYKFADAEIGAHSTMTAIMGRMATYSGQLLSREKLLAANLSITPTNFAFDAAPPLLPDANGFYAVAVPGVTKYA